MSLMKLSIKGQGHSLTLVKGHSDFKVKCLTFGLYTQVSNSGLHGPLVSLIMSPPWGPDMVNGQIITPKCNAAWP